MADAQAAAPAALPAGKKKFRNKKKAAAAAAAAKAAAPTAPAPVVKEEPPQAGIQAASNGHASPEEVGVQELNGMVQQLHLCNGREPARLEDEEQEEKPAGEPSVNGHHSNNNHIGDGKGSPTSSGNNNSCHNCSHSVDSSNNNSSCSSSNSNSNSNSSSSSNKLEESTEARSKSTANTATATATVTATATATKTTAAEAATATGTGSGDREKVRETEKKPVEEPQPAISADEIVYREYEAEHQMHVSSPFRQDKVDTLIDIFKCRRQDIMRLIQAELSEPYSIYTYRYFIYNWPKLCFLAAHDNQYVGAIVCKLDMHMNVRRGYIAMLAVRKEYRKLKIGTTLVTKAIEAMLADNADEVVLETEMRNEPALRLYENLGFVRDKRLFRYYLNGVDALRLKLWFR
ncbi:hypothetical protein KR018_004671 [Drosophila ironensis]|nr:hypothetical protein KR018_004671 [Drosophila ironensis]